MPIPQAVEEQVKAAEQFAQETVQDGDFPAETSDEESAVAGEEEYGQQGQEEDWEHKYKVLQGKYNAEVPRLSEENKQLKQNLAIMQERMSLLEQFVKNQTAQQQTQSNTSSEDTTSISSIKELQEDFPEVYNGVSAMLDALKKEIVREIESKLTGITQQTEQVMSNTFLSVLSELVPDWQELNTDSNFLAWLQEYDTFAGRTRHELLLDAYNAKDAKRVASFFIEFKNKYKKQQPVMPSQSKRYSASTNTKKKWTAEEIRKFYTDKALGKISPEKAKAIEADILKAMSEGRAELAF